MRGFISDKQLKGIGLLCFYLNWILEEAD